MINSKQTWIVLNILLNLLQPGNVQFLPMFPAPLPPPLPLPPPVYMPPPIQFMMPFAFRIPNQRNKTTTTTTTTTEQTIAIAIPMQMQMPMPVQVAVPAGSPPQFCQSRPGQPGCPPCPPCVCTPSCTPAFFSYCSPCHLKCRCRNKDDVPAPIPAQPPVPIPGPAYPIPVPPQPVVVVPFPPPLPRLQSFSSEKSDKTSSSSISSDTSSSEDSSSADKRSKLRSGGRPKSKGRNKKKHSKKTHKKYHKGKRRYRRMHLNKRDSELRPVLSYISRDGDVIFDRKISESEANQLTNDEVTDNRRAQTIHVTTKNRPGQANQVVVTSDLDTDYNLRSKQINQHRGIIQNLDDEGRKELVFRPPINKKISNLSVVFQVT